MNEGRLFQPPLSFSYVNLKKRHNMLLIFIFIQIDSYHKSNALPHMQNKFMQSFEVNIA